jgi:hypothetical protein
MTEEEARERHYTPPATCPACGWWYCVCGRTLVQTDIQDVNDLHNEMEEYL